QRATPLNRGRSALNWVFFLCGVMVAAAWARGRLVRNEAAIATAFPVAAVDFLQREGLASQLGFNPYAWGGYLIWRGVPVFVDGRADLYGDFLYEYLKTLRLTEEWRKPLDEFNVAYVLVERSNQLAALLTASGLWREVYADRVARVFVRAT